MPVWRRGRKQPASGNSDRGTQYGSDGRLRFCRQRNLDSRVSRCGNCWDSAADESFFSSLKHERIKKRVDQTRDTWVDTETKSLGPGTCCTWHPPAD